MCEPADTDNENLVVRPRKPQGRQPAKSVIPQKPAKGEGVFIAEEHRSLLFNSLAGMFNYSQWHVLPSEKYLKGRIHGFAEA